MPETDARHQPWEGYRSSYPAPPVSHHVQAQGSAAGDSRQAPRSYHHQPAPESEYAAYGSPSFPLPPLQGSNHFPLPAVQSAPRYAQHFQSQPQPLAWQGHGAAGSPRSGPLHLPPIRSQVEEHTTQAHTSGLFMRNAHWSFAQLDRAEDVRRQDGDPQAGYRDAPREIRQGHNRGHSHSHSQSQSQSSSQHLEYERATPSDDGTNRRWGGLGNDQPSLELEQEPAPIEAAEDTDSEEDESGKKKRKRRRKANEVPRDMSQRKYCCQQCPKSFARPSALITHERSHSKDRPCICPVVSCGRGFSVPSNLRRHQRLHFHPNPEPSRGSRSPLTDLTDT